MDYAESVPETARPQGNFWGDPDDFDSEVLEQECRGSVDPEEEAMRREEAEEQSQLADALDAEVALLDALNSGKVCAANLDVLVDEKNPNRKLDSHSPAPTLYV